MNINENKAIEEAEPTIKEWIQAGKNVQLPELYDDYVYYEEDLLKYPEYRDGSPELRHISIMSLLIDDIRCKFDCTRMQALRVVCYSLKDLLEKRHKHE